MKKKNIVISFLIFAIIYIIIAQKFGSKRGIEHFNRFNSENINGVIEYSKAGFHGSIFKIDGIENDFVFYPYTGEMNKNKIFHYIAEKGDIIVKKDFSDTLKLIKKNEIFLYTFSKRE